MPTIFTTKKEPVSDPQELRNADQQTAEDKLAFYRLYDQYASVMLGIITKMMSDKSEAAVILERSFVTISQQLSELKTGRQPMFVYLLSIARRTASDAIAIRKQSDISPLQLTETGKLTTPVWQTTRSIPLSDVPKNTADAQQNKFLNDVLFHNCTPEEAAASAGIPVAQARQKLRLAVQQLRNNQQIKAF